jgi:hypothetical protein
MTSNAPYTASYSVLPTFGSTNIGYIVPGSQLTPINIPSSGAIPYNTNYILGQFPNVDPGVYTFNYSGFYVGDPTEQWNTYLSTSTAPNTTNTLCDVNTNSFTTFLGSTPFLGTNCTTMSTVIEVSTNTTYYIIVNTPAVAGTASSIITDCSFSLCRIG